MCGYIRIYYDLASLLIWSSCFFQPEVVGILLWHYRERHVMMLLLVTYVLCQAIPATVNVFVMSVMS